MAVTDGVVTMTYGNVVAETLIISHLNNLPLHHRIDLIAPCAKIYAIM